MNPHLAELRTVRSAAASRSVVAVRWAVFDLQGRTVWSEDLRLAAGRTSLRWDGSIAGGGRAPNGVYLVRASVDGVTYNRRVVRFQ